MSDKFNGTLRIRNVDMSHLLPVDPREKKNQAKKDKKKKKKTLGRSSNGKKGLKKRGTSIDVVA